jgi:UDP-3-O-[3-hydroxymyristoyl] glucosamine N-acyltransferase
MSSPSFSTRPAGLTVGEIAALTGASPRAGARLDAVVTGFAAPESARPTDIVFLDDEEQADRIAATRAAVCLTTEALAKRTPANLSVLVTAEPFRDFVAVARKLYPASLRPSTLFEMSAVASGASVHPTAEIEDEVTIDPGAVIGPRAGIGSGTVIGPNAVIGPGVQIGRGCSVGAGASIVRALIGDGVIVDMGCRIGQSGARYQRSADGYLRVPPAGRVIIQDKVEIGANTVIDSGTIGDTVIGEGSKVDNLVQIGHNVRIGRHCMIVAQCGLSGGVTLADHVTLGGQVDVADNVTIGEGVTIGAKGSVTADIPASGTAAG